MSGKNIPETQGVLFGENGFDAEEFEKFRNMKPWERLEYITDHLKRGEMVSPRFIKWFCDAVTASNRNHSALVRQLGFVKKQGRPRRNDWMTYAKKVYDLAYSVPEGERHNSSMNLAAAVSKVLEDSYDLAIDDEIFDKSTLEEWYRDYRKLRNAE